MESKEYEIMYACEERHWWYVGLRELVMSNIKRFLGESGALRLLDAGCGTGRILEECSGYPAFGFDLSEEALKFCRSRKLHNVVRADIRKIPFRDRAFKLVVSLDVLYHRFVENDVQALEEIGRLLEAEGVLILNLPAYNFLRSRHDEAIYTRIRYTERMLKAKIEKAGFRIVRLTYRNTLLFPPALIARLLGKIIPRKSDSLKSDLKSLPAGINRLLTAVLMIENRMIASGLNLPFGLSLFCVAKKIR